MSQNDVYFNGRKVESWGALIRSARTAGMPNSSDATVLAISVTDTDNGENVHAYVQSETDYWDRGISKIFHVFDNRLHQFIIAMRACAGKEGDHQAVADRLETFITRWLITIDLHNLARNK